MATEAFFRKYLSKGSLLLQIEAWRIRYSEKKDKKVRGYVLGVFLEFQGEYLLVITACLNKQLDAYIKGISNLFTTSH